MPALLTLLLALAGEPVRVPHGETPTIDGRLAPGEWDSAARLNLEDGTTVLLQHDGEDVYVALRADAEVLGSLCIGAGDRVHVLHASMALARATYVRAGGQWALERGFAYAMREADFSPETLARRAAYHRAERWLANTTPMGDAHVREYRIARDLLTPVARLAVAYMRMTAARDIGSWPATRDDGCGSRALVMGDTPEPLQFDPATWLALLLEPPDAARLDAARAARAARMDPDASPGELVVAGSPPVWFEGFSAPAIVAPDGRRAIVGASAAGDLRVVEPQTGVQEPLDALGVGLESLSSATFDAGGRIALQGTSRGESGWFLRYGTTLRPLPLPADAVPNWAPEGERVAYHRTGSPQRGVTIMDATREQTIAVSGTVTATAWLSGGSLLVLAADDDGVSTLYRVRLATGTAEPVVRGLDAPLRAGHRGLAASPDGRRAYIALASAGAPAAERRHEPVAGDRDLDIYEVDLATGDRRPIVATPADEFAPVVADGHLYWSVSATQLDAVVLPAEGGVPRVVVEDAMLPTWSPDGGVLGFTFGEWRQADWVLNWDAGIVVVDEEARPVAAPTSYITGYHEDFSPVWSPDGRWIAYHSHRSNAPVVHSRAAGASDDVYLRRDGATDEIRLTDFGHEVGSPSWAPDGRRLVFTGWLVGAGRSGAWITTIDTVSGSGLGHRMLELPDEVGGALNAAWSPIADVIALSAPARRGGRVLWTVRTDGSPIRRLTTYPLLTYGGVAWTPDGTGLVFPAIEDGRMQLFTVPADGGEPVRLTNESTNLLHPAVSPDGRWIAATRIVHRRELRRMRLH